MRDERSRRRPRFRCGLELRLADGQVWSLPPAGVDATRDDPGYRAIVRAWSLADDDGDRFRAVLALLIHLLDANYALDPDDFEELLDDRGERRRQDDLAVAFQSLAMAHLDRSAAAMTGRQDLAADPGPHGVRRAIDRDAARIPGRHVARDVEGSVDRTA
jgi:hypothetical protein